MRRTLQVIENDEKRKQDAQERNEALEQERKANRREALLIVAFGVLIILAVNISFAIRGWLAVQP